MLKIYKILLPAAVFFALFTQISAQNKTAKDFFDEGVALVQAQKFNEALEAFRKSAQLDPRQPAAHANIGMALFTLSRVSESVAPFREAVRLSPAEPTFRTALCRSLILTNNQAEAVPQCEEAVRLGADLPDAQLSLIMALRSAKRSADAAQRADAALLKFADNEPLLNAAAEAFSEAENFSRALETYEKLAAIKPLSAYYQVKLAEHYLRFERDADALAAARKALETEPKHSLAYFYIGKIYYELGQHEEAAGAFQKSAELDPQFSSAPYFLGLSESLRGKPERAIDAFRRALAIEPNNFDFNKQLGSTLGKAKRPEEAVTFLKKALEINPRDFETLAGLGSIHTELAQFDEGIKYLMAADQLKPGHQIINMFLEVARARQQMAPRIGEMIAYAKENPQDLNVRLHLIQNLTYNRRFAEAEQYFEEIEKMNPKDVRVYELVATVRSESGNYEKAVAAYRRTLELGESPAAYVGLGFIYEKKGQIEEAMRAYEKVFALKPDTPNIMKLYADFLRDNGKRREALEMYKRSLAQLPNNSPAIFNAGILSAKLGDLTAARQYLETLKTVDPPTAKILARFLKLRW